MALLHVKRNKRGKLGTSRISKLCLYAVPPQPNPSLPSARKDVLTDSHSRVLKGLASELRA